MKPNKEQTVQHDPWTQLAQDAALSNVPLEQVLRQLRISQSEASAVKKGLLSKVNTICDDKPQ